MPDKLRVKTWQSNTAGLRVNTIACQSWRAELVRRPVAVIVAGGIPAVLAVKTVTSTIPVVFNAAGDPVRLGIVSSFNRPGGNITGVSFLGAEPVAKRLELLLEVVPKASVIGVLENPASARADLDRAELQAAASTMGKEIVFAKVTSERDFDAAFARNLPRHL